MSTELNLQQNQISLKEQHQVRQRLAAKKDVDYSQLQLGVTTLPSRGHMVNDPLWKAPIVAAEDTFQNIKNIGKGLKGEGNDHDLGRMNNVSMTAGGLAIAGYLSTKRLIPAKKGMEFVGFGAFLASMALWPKVFIQAPIQAMYGFNVNQQYVDSQGRKKSFHMDPQYTPWALYDSQKIDKIGDKMGIDPNMENRQSLVKEKMTKIATQANTLWMLTAGIAVPTMCALISSQAEKLVNIAHKEVKTKVVDAKFEALSAKLQKATESTEAPKVENHVELEALLADNEGKTVGQKFVKNIVDILAGGENHMLRTKLEADLTDMLHSNQVADVAAHLGDIQITDKVTLKKEAIQKELQQRGLNSNVLIGGPDSGENIIQIKNILTNMIKGHEGYQSADRKQRKAIDASASAALNTKFGTPSMILTKVKRDAIHEAYGRLATFRKDAAVLQEYVSHRIGDREDSVVARGWQDSTKALYKAIGFTAEDFDAAKTSPVKAQEILDKRLSALCAEGNTKAYSTAVSEVVKIAFGFEEELDKGIMKPEGTAKPSFLNDVKVATRKIYGNLGEGLERSSNTQGKFTRVADYISAHSFSNQRGYDAAKADVFPGSAAYTLVSSAQNRVLGAKNSMKKMLHMMDVYKRINSGAVATVLKAQGKDDAYISKVTSLMKHALMNGHLGDHVVKFDTPEREVYQDAMMHLYCMDKNHIGQLTKDTFAFGFTDGGKIVPIPIDKYTAQFQEHLDLAPETVKALGETHLEPFRTTLADIADRTVNDFYRFKPQHGFLTEDVLDSQDNLGLRGWKYENLLEYQALHSTTAEKQMTVGEVLANLTHDVAEQKTNTKSWFKLMGIVGVGVAAVTLVAPLFFGKVKAAPQQPQKQKREVEANV